MGGFICDPLAQKQTLRGKRTQQFSHIRAIAHFASDNGQQGHFSRVNERAIFASNNALGMVAEQQQDLIVGQVAKVLWRNWRKATGGSCGTYNGYHQVQLAHPHISKPSVSNCHCVGEKIELEFKGPCRGDRTRRRRKFWFHKNSTEVEVSCPNPVTKLPFETFPSCSPFSYGRVSRFHVTIASGMSKFVIRNQPRKPLKLELSRRAKPLLFPDFLDKLGSGPVHQSVAKQKQGVGRFVQDSGPRSFRTTNLHEKRILSLVAYSEHEETSS